MLAGTISQVVFALAYRSPASRGSSRALLVGAAGFAVATIGLSLVHWSAFGTLAVVLAGLAVGYALTVLAIPRERQPGSPVVSARR